MSIVAGTDDDVDELWEDLNLGNLLGKVTSLEDEKAGPDPLQKHKKAIKEPGYRVLTERYNDQPRLPSVATKSGLARLADPVQGKYSDRILEESNKYDGDEKSSDIKSSKRSLQRRGRGRENIAPRDDSYRGSTRTRTTTRIPVEADDDDDVLNKINGGGGFFMTNVDESGEEFDEVISKFRRGRVLPNSNNNNSSSSSSSSSSRTNKGKVIPSSVLDNRSTYCRKTISKADGTNRSHRGGRIGVVRAVRVGSNRTGVTGKLNRSINKERDPLRHRDARAGINTTTRKPLRSGNSGSWQDANRIDYSDPSGSSRGRRPGVPSQPSSRGRSSRTNSGTGRRSNRNTSRSRSADRENSNNNNNIASSRGRSGRGGSSGSKGTTSTRRGRTNTNTNRRDRSRSRSRSRGRGRSVNGERKKESSSLGAKSTSSATRTNRSFGSVNNNSKSSNNTGFTRKRAGRRMPLSNHRNSGKTSSSGTSGNKISGRKLSLASLREEGSSSARVEQEMKDILRMQGRGSPKKSNANKASRIRQAHNLAKRAALLGGGMTRNASADEVVTGSTNGTSMLRSKSSNAESKRIRDATGANASMHGHVTRKPATSGSTGSLSQPVGLKAEQLSDLWSGKNSNSRITSVASANTTTSNSSITQKRQPLTPLKVDSNVTNTTNNTKTNRGSYDDISKIKEKQIVDPLAAARALLKEGMVTINSNHTSNNNNNNSDQSISDGDIMRQVMAMDKANAGAGADSKTMIAQMRDLTTKAKTKAQRVGDNAGVDLANTQSKFLREGSKFMSQLAKAESHSNNYNRMTSEGLSIGLE